MASSSQRKQTMAKFARERALREKREAKKAKKEARKQAAAELEAEESGQGPEAAESPEETE
ncbi:MAG TPA: hypothetical protein VFW80_06305 [Gaiellaceae bacterium]|nr:hypothetical protein [Gaiellaceae bacterium]